MVFTIDIGNTNIVAGVVCKTGVRFVERMATDANKTDLEYAVLLRTILKLNDVSEQDIHGSIISSVVPYLTGVICEAVRKVLGKPALVVGPGIKTGLNIKIDNPAQLGADMAVGAVAGIKEYPVPQLIIDLGTATTISVIDKTNAFIGCIICPGIKTSLRSLVTGTSQLQMINLKAPAKAIGKNTIDSMASGSVYGNAAMLDGLIDRCMDELGTTDVAVIATGGLAPVILPNCRHKIIHDDELLLKGLYIVYNRNV